MNNRIESLLDTLRERAERCGYMLTADMRLLTERMALSGFSKANRISSGGTCRLLQTANGWLAINLARPEDIELLPAWIGCDSGPDHWDALAEILPAKDASILASKGQLLGLPVAEVGSAAKPEALQHGLPVRFKQIAAVNTARWTEKPLVLDFSSLWAGPLCGHLLTQAGARVIKVESTRRPDGARNGNEDFFDLLHAGQEFLALDLKSENERATLRALMKRADIIIEGSRPRAFEQMGFSPETIFAENPNLIWVSVTAYGRTGAFSNRVGFGDDVAAASGLVETDEQGNPFFIGDAIADPLTGIAAAASVLTALAEGRGVLIDVAMSRVAAYIAAVPDEMRREYLAAFSKPQARMPSSKAPALGADTERILRELA